MSRLRRIVLLLMVLTLLALPMATLADSGIKATSPRVDLAASVQNEYIRINMSSEGMAVVSTTGGDPGYTGDENKPLLYAHTGSDTSNSGTPTLRITRDGATIDYVLREVATSGTPRAEGQAVVAEWEIDGVHVTQSVSLAQNPFTDRQDMAKFSITLTNISDAELDAGLRLLLDLMIGDNDRAPILVPELGQLYTETDLGNAAYFRAFESDTFAADSLRALGIIRGYGLTSPDRTLLASWPSIQSQAWQYAITSGMNAGDSAIAYYWNPESLAPGASVTYETLYGLGAGGGTTWFDAPSSVPATDGAFSATLWVSNTTPFALTGGQTTLMLPAGLSLASGSNVLAFPDVPADGVASVTIALVADTTAPATYAYSAETTFNDTQAPLVAEGSITVLDAATPTPGPTPTAVPDDDDETPEVPEPGSLTLLALGLGGLAAAWKRRHNQ